VNALSDQEVGEYFARHFVATYQRVGTFDIVGNAKQGGNVASYFCKPDLSVLHAVAGPVNATQMLKEARWTVEANKHAALVALENTVVWKTIFRKAHLDRLEAEHGVNVRRLALPATNQGMYFSVSAAILNQLRAQNRGANNAGKVHQLFAAYPLVELGRVYTVVFDNILNEKVSTLPVAQR